jgi:hypothetical protein
VPPTSVPPAVALDNNLIENQMRPVAHGRKIGCLLALAKEPCALPSSFLSSTYAGSTR